MQHYVLGFVFSADKDQVLLTLKARPDWQAGNWNGVGGKVEEDDASSAAAMQRECIEETGLDIDESFWANYATLKSESFQVEVFSTSITDLTDAQTMTDEQIAVHPYPAVLSGPSPLISNLPWLIPMALDEASSYRIVTV